MEYGTLKSLYILVILFKNELPVFVEDKIYRKQVKLGCILLLVSKGSKLKKNNNNPDYYNTGIGKINNAKNFTKKIFPGAIKNT